MSFSTRRTGYFPTKPESEKGRFEKSWNKCKGKSIQVFQLKGKKPVNSKDFPLEFWKSRWSAQRR